MKKALSKNTFIRTMLAALSVKPSWSRWAFLLGLVNIAVTLFCAQLDEHLVNLLHQVNSSSGLLLSHIIVLLLGTIVLRCLSVLIITTQNYAKTIDNLHVTQFIKKRIISSITTVKYKYLYTSNTYSNHLNILNTLGSSAIEKCFAASQMILLQGISVVVLGYSVFKQNPLLFFILSVSSIPLIIVESKKTEETQLQELRDCQQSRKVMHDFSELVGTKEMVEVRYWKISHWLKSHWKIDLENYISKKKKVVQRYIPICCFAAVLKSIVFILIIVSGCLRIYKSPTIGIGYILLIVEVSSALQSNMLALGNNIIIWLANQKYLKMFWSLDMYKPAPNVPSQFSFRGMFLDNITYKYANSDFCSLNNICMHIHPNETLLIVGANGAGKTTLLDLICGFLSPISGRIFINDEEQLQDFALPITTVLQNYSCYDTTIIKNITLSDDTNVQVQSKILALCQLIGLDSFIATLENGLFTEVGTQSGHGTNLSKGQWQKLAIIRAAYKDSASIAILDEPTAALSPDAESMFYTNFNKLFPQSTRILVTHRLSAAHLADRIIVMDRGKIIEDGTHLELMAKKGQYYTLYSTQATLYNEGTN